MGYNLDNGTLEEIAIPYFERLGYSVKLAEKDSFHNLEISRRNEVKRINVRTTSNKQNFGKYALNVTHDVRGGSFDFKKDSCDAILAYIVPEKRTVLIDAKEIGHSNTSTVYID